MTTYEKSSMSDIALGSLRTSAIEEVVIVGRRGQVFAACSTSELLAMSRLPGVDLVADPAEATVTEHELEAVSPGGVACHEHGTTLSGFLPISWDQLVASYGTTRRVVPVESSGRSLTRLVVFVGVEVNSGGVPGGWNG
ncbi:hypothetical protein [Leekyejoonella antrihumi]|uniref:Uncharacterized protein n=1 Tax=Leekyejoonella antrihumi TaxID=1660198 RepID=A0A563E1K3_9MICO|nr:hypothetical protein [Leekyejoonella antrihumi]TWP36407.1 hypothetical protein FGL98_10650 [Leekyejoonella antrihumi]